MSPKPVTAPTKEIESLKQQLSDRETEIALLKETAEAVNSELDLHTVLNLVAHRAQTLIQAKTLLIPILDENCKNYTYKAGVGVNADEIVGESMPIEYGVCGWVWRHNRPWWHGVLDELEEEERNRWEKEAGTMIMVPLAGKRHFLGGIAGIDKADGSEFNKRDLDLLTLFADQVSFAIENAELFEQLNNAQEKMEAHRVELKSLNIDLERRVEARTADIASANLKLQKQALHDSLTQLPNRALINDRIDYSILRARRDKKPLALVVLDLDRFKIVNDTLGHRIGDLLLKEVSARLLNVLRDSDTVGRLGGDEFAIILPGTDRDSARIVATKVIKALELPFTVEGNILSPGASLGIAVYPDNGPDTTELLKCADAAMYVAKRGDGGYYVYDTSEDEDTLSHLDFIAELRHAMHADQFQLYYQPQVDMVTGQVCRVEALARWPHPERGQIPPDEFIPVLEQTGLIKPFTEWVLDTALGQCAAWRKAKLDLTIGVNLSMHNLCDPQLPELLSILLKKWKIEGDALILEITETAIMHDPVQVMRILTRIDAIGVQFSIDDFGTGYSCLAYLKKLSVAELKIDKSFVIDMATDHDDAMIVQSTIDLAHNLGLEVVAEGVESQEVLDSLNSLKCDIAQGYYISRPLPASELTDFFSTTGVLRRSIKTVKSG